VREGGFRVSLTREDLERRRRAIADSKIVAYLDEEARQAVQMLTTIREVLASLDGLQPSQLKEVMDMSRKIKEEAEKTHRDLLGYISRVSPILYHREDWLRATYKVRNVIDKLSGILYRLEYLASRGWLVTPPVRSSMVELCDSVVEVVETFRQLLNLIVTNPSQALSQCSKLSLSEASADSKFRSSSFAILSSNLSPNTIILLLNIAEMLEDVSDTLYSASEDIYIVLMNMVS